MKSIVSKGFREVCGLGAEVWGTIVFLADLAPEGGEFASWTQALANGSYCVAHVAGKVEGINGQNYVE